MANRLRIGLIGAAGRLGSAIATIVEREFSGEASVEATIGRTDGGSFTELVPNLDVVIDVSLPAATESYLAELQKQKSQLPYVIGCTGWSDAQLKRVRDYAKVAPVILAPNFSPGVNLMLGILEQTASVLEKWGYDVVVHETHHTKKLDAPSGTAKAIVQKLGNMKPQVHASRAGNIVGTHEVRFIGPGDIFSIAHEALDRSIFARGAVLAAEWAGRQKKPGLYSMKDVVFGSSD